MIIIIILLVLVPADTETVSAMFPVEIGEEWVQKGDSQPTAQQADRTSKRSYRSITPFTLLFSRRKSPFIERWTAPGERLGAGSTGVVAAAVQSRYSKFRGVNLAYQRSGVQTGRCGAERRRGRIMGNNEKRAELSQSLEWGKSCWLCSKPKWKTRQDMARRLPNSTCSMQESQQSKRRLAPFRSWIRLTAS